MKKQTSQASEKAARKTTAKAPSGLKSRKNLTRFDYDKASFEGWRLSVSKAGTNLTRYFPDKKFGSPEKSLAAAEKALAELRTILAGAKLVDGKLSPATVKKAEKFLADAV